MLKLKILHPELLYSLAMCGHGSKILIADANFPVATKTPPTSRKVFVNIAPGLVNATTMLQLISEIIPLEDVVGMATPDEKEEPVHTEYRALLGSSIRFTTLKRSAFYECAVSEDTCLVVATGEIRRFANLLLTVSVIKPGMVL